MCHVTSFTLPHLRVWVFSPLEGESKHVSTYRLLSLQWFYCLFMLMCVQADDFRASYSNRLQLSQQLWAALMNNNS